MHIIDETNKTLKETSFDDEHKVYMVDSTLEVYSFDEVTVEEFEKEFIQKQTLKPTED